MRSNINIVLFLLPLISRSRSDLNITLTSQLEENFVTRDTRTCGFDDVEEGWLNEQPFQFSDGDINPPGEEEMKNILPGDEILPPWNSNKNSRFVELVLVVDTRLYIQFGRNQNSLHNMCKQIANKINSIYLSLDIYIALVGIVIWRDYDQIQLSSNAELTLQRFLHYRKQFLSRIIPNDNAQLLTGLHFDKGIVGKALKGPICTSDFSGGVSVWDTNDLDQVAATVAHELGHNLGLEHDSPECECPGPGPGGCLMSSTAFTNKSTQWSSCSREYLRAAYSQGMDYCLRNVPQQIFGGPVCGNGFTEPGEDCDCGLVSDCTNPCCDPETCRLTPGSTCGSGLCCEISTCSLASPSSQCRPASSECDLAEWCDGQTAQCPPDIHKAPGLPCSAGEGFCYSGHCGSHTAQCRLLWGAQTQPSPPQCFSLNRRGDQRGNCGFTDGARRHYRACRAGDEMCGLMHCQHEAQNLQLGLESVAIISSSFIQDGRDLVACRNALVDLGLSNTDPGLAPAGSKCGEGRMCLNQKCVSVDEIRVGCRENCSAHGVCSSLGRCHCEPGWSGETCSISQSQLNISVMALSFSLLLGSALILLTVLRRLDPLHRFRRGDDVTVLIEKSASDEWHSRASHQLPKPRAFQL